MSRKIYKPEDILAKLREVESLTAQGKSAVDAIRAIGVTDATYNRWCREYGDLNAEAVFRVRPKRVHPNTAPPLDLSKETTKRVIEFDRLAEAVPQIVWITGSDGKNIYFNKQWEDYTGLSVEEGHGHGWNIPFHPDDRQRAWEAWQHAWQTDGVYSLECRLRRADGIYRWWLVRGRALHDAQGTIINWYGTWTDVEDIKQTEQALKRARDEAEAMNEKLQTAYDEIRNLYEKTKALNQFKTQMFANVSHELRTPLTLILAPIENLLSMGLPEEATERLKLAQRNARGLLKQINDLLDVARLEAGKTTVTYHETDMAKLIKHIASSFEIPANEKNLQFSVTTPSSAPSQIDIEKFERILVNLLSNAFKFTPEGGTIRCQLHEASGSIAVIEVIDSGPGIPEPFRDSIFEQFFQIPGSTRFGGTGLGLSIVKEFVEIQHGHVTVGQSTEGGARFRLEIPVKAPEGTPVIRRPHAVLTAPSFVEASLPHFRRKKHEQTRLQEPDEEFSNPKQKKPLILVVEDNADMRDYICETLGPDVAIETAENGREGFEKAELLVPDLIISDIMMPEMGGDEMFRKIRANRDLKAIPFILVTAKADEELRISLLREGAIEYLIKPFIPEELKAKATSFLKVKAREAKYRQLMVSAQVDVGMVIKASQAVSGEIELDKLIETLLRIAVEHAGAERGLLILCRSQKLWLEAEAATGNGDVEVIVRKAEVTPADLPESLLRHVTLTQQSVILDDAAAPSPFSADAYMRQRQPSSVLCLPLVKQAKLVGALYLENNLTPRVFTSNRIAILEVLASQAAISLENAALFADLQQENAERRRAEEELRSSEAFLAEGQRISRTGSWRWNISTGNIVWSEEYFRMFGLNPEATAPTLQAFLDRVHPEDRTQVQGNLYRAIQEKSSFSHEYRIILPDGSIKHLHGVGRPVLTTAGDLDEFVGTTMDITERERREEALRIAQADLTRVARLTTMGELAASIAHEINQPLGAMVASGNACIRWLTKDQPQLDEARRAAERLVRDGHRAGDILKSLRALAGASAPDMTKLDINDAIREVLILTRSELHEHDVLLGTELSNGLAHVMGDRVQLQQVILNLVMNAIEAMSTDTNVPRMLYVRSQGEGPGGVLITVEDFWAGDFA